ncbi:hypothetical protein AAC387_Pa09g0289 [Persea americana]
MMEQSLTAADNSNCPLHKKKKKKKKKKKRLQYSRVEREFIGMMKNKRKRRRLMSLLDRLLPYEKDLVENEKKQLYEDQKGILKYNGPNPLRELPQLAFIPELSLHPRNTNVITPCQNVLAWTDYINCTMLASQGQVMTNLPQQEGNEQPFDQNQMHCMLLSGQREQQDSQSLQNYQLSEWPSMLRDQNYKVGATNVSDFPPMLLSSVKLFI